jgi:hypothetical protein
MRRMAAILAAVVGVSFGPATWRPGQLRRVLSTFRLRRAGRKTRCKIKARPPKVCPSDERWRARRFAFRLVAAQFADTLPARHENRYLRSRFFFYDAHRVGCRPRGLAA